MALHKPLESAREAALKSVDGHLQPQALGEGKRDAASEAGVDAADTLLEEVLRELRDFVAVLDSLRRQHLDVGLAAEAHHPLGGEGNRMQAAAVGELDSCSCLIHTWPRIKRIEATNHELARNDVATGCFHDLLHWSASIMRH